MEDIKRIVKRKDFALYNIPDTFSDEAVITIKARNRASKEKIDESLELTKIQEQAGMISMLNDPKEDVWNGL